MESTPTNSQRPDDDKKEKLRGILRFLPPQSGQLIQGHGSSIPESWRDTDFVIGSSAGPFWYRVGRNLCEKMPEILPETISILSYTIEKGVLVWHRHFFSDGGDGSFFLGKQGDPFPTSVQPWNGDELKEQEATNQLLKRYLRYERNEHEEELQEQQEAFQQQKKALEQQLQEQQEAFQQQKKALEQQLQEQQSQLRLARDAFNETLKNEQKEYQRLQRRLAETKQRVEQIPKEFHADQANIHNALVILIKFRLRGSITAEEYSKLSKLCSNHCSLPRLSEDWTLVQMVAGDFGCDATCDLYGETSLHYMLLRHWYSSDGDLSKASDLFLRTLHHWVLNCRIDSGEQKSPKSIICALETLDWLSPNAKEKEEMLQEYNYLYESHLFSLADFLFENGLRCNFFKPEQRKKAIGLSYILDMYKALQWRYSLKCYLNMENIDDLRKLIE